MIRNEHDLSIIEFCGVPGAGKSTISRELISYLNTCGYNVLDFSLYRSSLKQNWFKRNLGRLKLMFGNIKMILWLFKFRPLNIYYRLKHLLDALWIANELSKTKYSKYDVIVVDQGVIQAISAVMDTNEYVGNDRILETFLRTKYLKYTDVTVVTCLLDYDEASKRLKSRSRANNSGKLDSISNEHLLHKLYNSIGYNLIKISEYLGEYISNTVELNTHQDIRDNISILRKILAIKRKG